MSALIHSSLSTVNYNRHKHHMKQSIDVLIVSFNNNNNNDSLVQGQTSFRVTKHCYYILTSGTINIVGTCKN